MTKILDFGLKETILDNFRKHLQFPKSIMQNRWQVLEMLVFII